MEEKLPSSYPSSRSLLISVAKNFSRKLEMIITNLIFDPLLEVFVIRFFLGIFESAVLSGTVSLIAMMTSEASSDTRADLLRIDIL